MLKVLVFSFLAGVVGTMIGAVISVVIKRTSDRAIGIANCFASGFMLAITFLDLVPSSIAVSNVWVLLGGVLIGIVMIVLCTYVISKSMRRADKHRMALGGVESKSGGSLKSGIIILVAIALHNFPEGMAIGSQEVVLENSAIAMTILIGLHNIPEGVAVSAPLAKTGMKWYKVLCLVFLTGVPTVLGAALGHYIGDLNKYVSGLCLAIAAGAMLYVVFEEMLYESYKNVSKRDTSIYVILGIAIGIVVITLI